jgi:hypothetical protein
MIIAVVLIVYAFVGFLTFALLKAASDADDAMGLP